MSKSTPKSATRNFGNQRPARALSVYRGGRSLSAVSDSTLEKNEFWVMQCLGVRANFLGEENFQEWLGSIPLDWISTWTRLGESSVREAMHRLIAAGYVESRKAFGNDGRQLGNEYRITGKIFDEYALRLAERHPDRDVVFEKTRPKLTVVPSDPCEVPPPGDLDAPAAAEQGGYQEREGGGPPGKPIIPVAYTGDNKALTSTHETRACVRVDPPSPRPAKLPMTEADFIVQEIFHDDDWRFKNPVLRRAASEALARFGLEALVKFRDDVVSAGDDGRLRFRRAEFMRALKVSSLEPPRPAYGRNEYAVAW